MKRQILLFLCAFGFVLSGQNLLAQCTFESLLGAGQDHQTTGGDPFGSTFAPTCSGVLQSVEIAADGTQSGITLEVFSGTGFGGTKLGEATGLSVTDSEGSTVLRTLDISGQNISLTGGQTYTFRVTGAAIYYNQTNTLPNIFYYNGSPVNFELIFRVNVGAAADTDPPGITSFTRKTPSTSPTNANSLVFLATFDEDVQAVDAADFAVNSTSTATITDVTQVTASTYDITVSGGDLAGFDGSVGINLSGSQNITDLASNALPSGEPTTDETYTVDNTAPSGYSVTVDQSPVNSGNETAVSFTFASAEVGASYSYSISSSGGGTPVTSTGTVASATETISGIDVSSLSDGTLTLSVTLTDPAGNAGSAATDTENYDGTAPTASSFARQTPASSPTNSNTLVFRATFSEAVSSVDAADFAVNGTTTATVSAVSSVSSSVYDVTVSGGDLASFDGSVGLNLSGSQNITDSEGNSLTSSEPATDETYTVDNTAPTGYTVTVDQSPVNSGNETAVSFTFASAEVGASYSYSISSSGGGTPVTSSGTVASATETISGIDVSGLSDGTITLSVTLTDVAGNAGSATTDTEAYDATAPTINSFTRETPATSPTNSNSLIFRATFSEDVSSVDESDFAVNGTTSATVSAVNPISSSVYDVTISGGDLPVFNGTVGLNINGSHNITDLSGNSLTAGEPPSDETFTLDNTAPSGYSVTINQSPINASNETSVGFTFAGAEVGSTYNYSFSSSGGGTPITSSSTIVSATETVSGIDISALSDGTVTLSVTLTDVAGNAGSAATDTENYDATAPSITSFTRKTPSSSATNANSLVFLATFDEDVTAVDATDFAVNSTSTATVSGVAQVTASTYDITVSGGDLASFEGSVGLNLSGSQNITDLASNALPSGEPTTDETYAVDNTAPSGYSVTIDQSPVNAGNDNAVSFTFAGAETGATYNYSFSSSGGGTPVTSSGTVAS
ncbi:MAG: hypothetical protein MI784_13885, partial [Cytophagales bacterium]|nr:hypothetical protein [Cytophagales bacterium]